MPSPDKVMPHDQMHWLKILIFTQANRNCIIMYKDTVRNIHACACRGIHGHVIIFKFPMKMKSFGPIETKLFHFHFHRISKNRGHGGGSRTPESKLDPPLLIHAF